MTHPLDQYSHVIHSNVGGVIPGVRAVFRTKDLHQSMDAFEMRLMGQLIYGITGREYTPSQIALIEAVFYISAYPDTRIWCNRVAGLAGSTRSTPVLAQCAAGTVAEAQLYGRRIETRAFNFIRRTMAKLKAGVPLRDCLEHQLKKHKLFPGYGRPLASADERIKPFLEYHDKAGIAVGPHVQLAFEIEKEILAMGKPLYINYGAVWSAFAADMGFSQREFATLWTSGFWNGIAPCYLNAEDNPALSLYPLSTSDVVYVGPNKRSLPSE